MSLTIERSVEGPKTTVSLTGKLDTNTAPQMRPIIDDLQQHTPMVLVLDLAALEYISSAGLRCVFQLRKLMKASGGSFAVSQPSPQVRKVFDIVKAVPVQSVFSSTEELDAYLDKMQKQVSRDE